MIVYVKLYGTLRQRLKNYNSHKGIKITIEKSLSIIDLLHMFNINPKEVSVVFINNNAIKDLQSFLRDKDNIKIFSYFPAGG